MSEIHKPISTLVIKSLIGEATQAEITQLEEWASLSVENWIWLEHFKNPEWIMREIKEQEAIDVESYAVIFRQRLHLHEIKTAQRKRIRHRVYATAAAAVLIILITSPWLYKYLLRDAVQLTQTTPASTIPVIHAPAPLANPTPLAAQLATTRLPNALVHKKDHSEKQLNTKKAATQAAGEPAASRSTTVTMVDLPVSHAQMPAAQEQEPAVPYSTLVNTITAPRQKDHRILNKEKTILKDRRLPDGSAYTLNADSEIYYPEGSGHSKRKIALNGEGLINVVHQRSNPFLLATNGILIATDSGSFNVRSYPTETQAEITALTATLLVTTEVYTDTIHPGETVCIASGSPAGKDHWNTDKITAYSNRLFYFDNDDLNRAAREIARWYGLTLAGADNAHIKVSFQGRRTKKPEEVITKLVTSDGKQHLRIEGTRLILD